MELNLEFPKCEAQGDGMEALEEVIGETKLNGLTWITAKKNVTEYVK